MPFVLGAHTFGFLWGCLADEALERLGEAGLRHVQLMAPPPHYDPWTQVPALTRRLGSILERHGMSLLALDLASSDINLASPSVDVVDFAVDAYARAIDRAAELGAKWICVGSGRRHTLPAQANDRRWRRFVPRSLESTPRRSSAVSASSWRIILRVCLLMRVRLPAFRTRKGYSSIPVIYDVANAFAIDEDPVAGLETLWSRLGIVHLSDSPPGQWRHDPIGSGAIDFSAIAAFLGSKKFEGAVVLEILSDPLARADRWCRGAENERVRVLGNYRTYGLVAVDEEDRTVSSLTKEMYFGETFLETCRRCGQRTG
jgi:deoxyribonuclease-4